MRKHIKLVSTIIFWATIISTTVNLILILSLAHLGKVYWLPIDPINPIQKTSPDASTVLLNRNTYINGKAKTINGTGTFIGKNIILTAAHVTHDGKADSDDTQEWVIRTNWDQAVTNTKLTNPNSHVCKLNAKTVEIHVHYYGNNIKKNYALSSVPQTDLALIILPETFDARQLGADIASVTYQKHPKSLTYTGYPFETLPESKKGTVYKGTGVLEPTVWNNQNIHVMNSQTYQGMSGSSVRNEKNQIIGLLSMYAYMEPLVSKDEKASVILHFDQKQVNWIQSQIALYGNP